MLRDRSETALTDLLQSVHQAASAYRSAAEALDGCAEAKLFAGLAQAAQQAHRALDGALLEAGTKPPAPDVELSFFRSLLTRGQALLLGDERLTLIEHCQELEAKVLSTAELSGSLGPTGGLRDCVELQASRAREALQVLGSMRLGPTSGGPQA